MSDCTFVTSGHHGSIRTTFISNNSITQKTCNRKYTWLPFLFSTWGTENFNSILAWFIHVIWLATINFIVSHTKIQFSCELWKWMSNSMYNLCKCLSWKADSHMNWFSNIFVYLVNWIKLNYPNIKTNWFELNWHWVNCAQHWEPCIKQLCPMWVWNMSQNYMLY